MNDPITDTPGSPANGVENSEALFDQILEFVGDSPQASSGERRFRDRYPISCKMHLTPIDARGAPMTDETSVIFGKNLSRRGISFSHELPLPHRRVLISLTDPQVGQFIVEAEITWSQRTLIGLYETGCRLIRKIAGHKISLRGNS